MKHKIKGKRAFSNDALVAYLRAKVRPNSSLLDLGCGPKLYSDALKAQCDRVLTVDAWDWVEPDIVADLEQTSLRDITGESFDYVLMLDFIEHLSRDAGIRLIGEVKQQCQGAIILLTPLEEIWTENHENVDNPDLWCHGNRFDLHRSVWQAEDFPDFQPVTIVGFKNYYVGCWEHHRT